MDAITTAQMHAMMMRLRDAGHDAQPSDIALALDAAGVPRERGYYWGDSVPLPQRPEHGCQYPTHDE